MKTEAKIWIQTSLNSPQRITMIGSMMVNIFSQVRIDSNIILHNNSKS